LKDVLIFGAGQIAEVFAEYLDLNHFKVRAFVVDADRLTDGVFCERPVVALEDVQKEFSPEAYQFIVGMSFRGLNAPRASKFDAMRSKGYEPLTFVDRNARVAPSARIGAGTFIMGGNVVQAGVVISNNCVLWETNHIGHHSRIANHVFIASHAVISGAVEIGERSFVGVNVAIADGVKVGEGCILGMGSVISRDCAAHGVYWQPSAERASVPSYRMRGIWAGR
jgi:sugar O-acyltransferase (sialic acid O-acetyltransferase NeuD family)